MILPGCSAGIGAAAGALEVAPQNWVDTLRAASALYRRDACLQVLASADFSRESLLVNTEGTIVRDGKALYNVHVHGNTQAADGMRLNRGWSLCLLRRGASGTRQDLGTSDKVIAGLKELREAPMADEDYRGQCCSRRLRRRM